MKSVILKMFIVPLVVFGLAVSGCPGTGPGDIDSSDDDSTTTTGLETVAKPSANPAAGEVSAGTTVALSTSTAGAAIHYTTDGSAPTTGSVKYQNPIAVNAAMTIKAIAAKEGMNTSAVLEAAYTIKQGEPSPFSGAWVLEDWGTGGFVAFIFRDDRTVTVNGMANGTYDDSVTPATMRLWIIEEYGTPPVLSTGTIEIVSEELEISGFPGKYYINDTYQKGGVLTLKDAPPVLPPLKEGQPPLSNYRVYISETPWTNANIPDDPRSVADDIIQAMPGRTPGANDIANEKDAGIYWLSGEGSGTYHVLIIPRNGERDAWKYKNNVEFSGGNNVTEFGYSEMTAAQ